ncbi:redoxin domain-containing protein [Rosistilla oblonga]|uniref:redoxin domain-containing protein n=1 Tax=Rosistilla oblonga TaxID=2527990 RepID=UPI003A97C476
MLRSLVAALLVVASIASPLSAADSLARHLGTQLSQIDADDFRGRRWQLEDFDQPQLLVVAFLGTQCPLAKLYATRLVELEKEYASRGVGFVAVMSNTQDSIAEIAAFARDHKLTFPVLKDAGNRIADRLAAERTPEVFLLDRERKVIYWGRVDDQYGIGYARDFPRSFDLKNAIDDRLADRPIKTPVTRSIGCIIGRQKKADSDSKITFGNQVSRILQKHCVECHREGEIAPFALTDYDEVSGWADMIAETVRGGRMPPWHADPAHGSFANDRSMSDEDKQTLYDWADAGAPAGDLANLPEPIQYTPGWLLPKEPDMVVNVSPEPFEVPADGAVKYQYFRVDPGFTEDKWLRYAELQPGNREVVHHILAFARDKDGTKRLNAERGYLVGYVPGTRIEPIPKGWAKKIPAGSELIFQVHYTPIGSPQIDHSRLGMIFADDSEVTHEIVTTSAVQPRLNIPPGDDNYTVTAVQRDLPDSQLLGFSPHMHLRGKAFRYELIDPSGDRSTLLDIPAYDFNWQTFYLFDNPMSIDAGSQMLCTAAFDNSSKNLNNPDPTATVRWGDQTWDEMMIGYFHYAVPRGEAKADAATMRQRAADEVRRNTRLRVFERIDIDGDGKITRKQTPAQLHATFDRLDRNGDSILTRAEVETGD